MTNKTKELLSNYIDKCTAKVDTYPPIVAKAMDCISGQMPFKMKLAITLSELITFTSHLRKPITLHDDTIVPVNAIFFILAGSGASKDKSLNAIRKSLSNAYVQLEDRRKNYAKEKAESQALLEGDSADNWASYYKTPKPLQAGLGTVEGLSHHFAEIDENPIGAGSIMSNEVGSELQTNGNMIDIIKIISIAYDLGNLPPKIVKSYENQTSEIKGLPISALFFGSQEAILFDNQIKQKFKLVFNTQLARRSMFTFSPETPVPLEIKSIDELYVLREAERSRVQKAQEFLNNMTSDLVDNTTHDILSVSPSAQKLFDVYQEYNNFVSDDMLSKFPISKLSRKHKYWLALKLSGCYAILDESDVITEAHYCYAINTIELLSNDLTSFEKELVKEPYEQLADMCRIHAKDGEYQITLHELRKLSYVTGTGASKGKVDELCNLAASYDNEGSYFSDETGITYKKLVKTDIVGISFKLFEDTKLSGKKLKDYMNRNSKDGYEFRETDFEDLENLLLFNGVYSCFQFEDGIHSKEHLVGGTKFAVLDIDKSVITDEECHVLLEEYNHFIVRTSDKDNEFKFRVLIELDAVVDVDPITWKSFVQEIATELGLIVDPIPQSQIVLTYKDRTILKQLEGKPLSAKVLLDKAAISIKDRPKAPNTLPTKEKKTKLDDPRTTFTIGFEAEMGERSNVMYRMLKYAVDLGADEDYVRNLAKEINEYWSESMDEARLERTLITPIVRNM